MVSHSHHQVWPPDSAAPSEDLQSAAAAHWSALDSVCRFITEENTLTCREDTWCIMSNKAQWLLKIIYILTTPLTDLQRDTNSVHLFSVSSSLRVLWASSSWACRAAIFSLSYSSCCTLSILFSCCSLMNFSLNNHKQKVRVLRHKDTHRSTEKTNPMVTITCTQWVLTQLPGYHGWDSQREAFLHERIMQVLEY